MKLEEAKIVAKFQKNDIDIKYAFNMSLIKWLTTFANYVNGFIFFISTILMIFNRSFARKYFDLYIAFVILVFIEMFAVYEAKKVMHRQYVAILYNSTKATVEDIDEYQRLDDEQKVYFFNEHFSDLIGMEETTRNKED
jgi:hypothetical protein